MSNPAMRELKLYTVKVDGAYKQDLIPGTITERLCADQEPSTSEYHYKWRAPKGFDKREWDAIIGEEPKTGTDEEKEDYNRRQKKRMDDYPCIYDFSADLTEDEFMQYCIERSGESVSIQATKVIKYTPNFEGNSSILQAQALQMECLIQLGEKCLHQMAHASEMVFNAKVGAPVCNEFLSMVNSTMLLEDVCTDVLQGMLSKGWRILCITPQPDQRRADYVMGRYDPALDKGDEKQISAWRSWDVDRGGSRY